LLIGKIDLSKRLMIAYVTQKTASVYCFAGNAALLAATMFCARSGYNW
jgi:hypothetical protein